MIDCSANHESYGDNSCYTRPEYVIDVPERTTGRPTGLLFACQDHLGIVIQMAWGMDPERKDYNVHLSIYEGE